MAELLVDLGNTRLKLARHDAGRLGRMIAREHRSSRRAMAASLRPFRCKVSEVVAVSVAGNALENALARAVHDELLRPLRFVRSTDRMRGMAVGYQEPWRLGADRWVAAVGGFRHTGSRAVVVVDAGTALTIDVVDATGRHRGGLIVPGPDMMVDALLTRTRGIRVRAAGTARSAKRSSTGLQVGRNTRDAIELGAAQAAAGLIDRVYADAVRTLRTRPVLLVTGGAAPNILRQLRTARARLVPDLVLRGLAEFVAAARKSR